MTEPAGGREPDALKEPGEQPKPLGGARGFERPSGQFRQAVNLSAPM